jgi:hypothetical protein
MIFNYFAVASEKEILIKVNERHITVHQKQKRNEMFSETATILNNIYVLF